jgi:hypothetical protein
MVVADERRWFGGGSRQTRDAMGRRSGVEGCGFRDNGCGRDERGVAMVDEMDEIDERMVMVDWLEASAADERRWLADKGNTGFGGGLGEESMFSLSHQ